MLNSKRLVVKSPKEYTFTFTDNNGKQSYFHCSKDVLNEHRQKLSNNKFIKSFNISNYKG